MIAKKTSTLQLMFIALIWGGGILSAYPASILIDLASFGVASAANDPQGRSWNVVSPAGTVNPTTIANLVDTNNVATGISLTADPLGSLIAQANTGSSAAGFPDQAALDFFANNSTTLYNIVFNGLTNGQAYNFTLYSSRAVAGTDRDTFISVTGSNSGNISINSANNTSLFSINAITPSANSITLSFSKLAASDQFGYLNFIQIDSVPEPGAGVLLGLGLLVWVVRRRFRSI
jgi:hypothetical protein